MTSSHFFRRVLKLCGELSGTRVVQLHLHSGLNATSCSTFSLRRQWNSQPRAQVNVTKLDLKGLVEVWVCVVSAERRVVPSVRRSASLSVNRGAVPARRAAPGEPPLSVVGARAALTVLVCRGSARWGRNGLDLLFKVCDDYSQVSNCDLQMLGAAPVDVF